MVRSLSLPISTVTATVTILLPVFTGISLRGAQQLSRRHHGFSGDPKTVFSWSSIAVFILLVIYETVIATLSLTHMAPPSNLSCQLERRWTHLFSTKNADAIRRIQDRHRCCGFNSVQDRAWPFPDVGHTAAACHEAFGRQRRCFGAWRQDEQVAGGLMLLVAVVAFLLKVTPLSVLSFFADLQTLGEGADLQL